MIKALYPTIGVSVLALVGAAAAAYFKAQADTHKVLADARLTTIEVLQASNASLINAHRREIDARDAREKAGEDARRAHELRADAAERRLYEARKLDPKLDECLRSDFGVDLSGGLLRFPTRDPGP